MKIKENKNENLRGRLVENWETEANTLLKETFRFKKAVLEPQLLLSRDPAIACEG
jgi:hypothetical protein